MNHEEWKEKISSLLDGELPADEGAAVENHRRECAECDALARNWGNISRAFFTAPVERSSEEFVQSVMARIPQSSRDAVGGGLPAVQAGWKRWAWAAAAAAGMLAMSFPFEALQSAPVTERLLLDDANE